MVCRCIGHHPFCRPFSDPSADLGVHGKGGNGFDRKAFCKYVLRNPWLEMVRTCWSSSSLCFAAAGGSWLRMAEGSKGMRLYLPRDFSPVVGSWFPDNFSDVPDWIFRCGVRSIADRS
nr:hypothetical protein [uncultured bacterium]